MPPAAALMFAPVVVAVAEAVELESEEVLLGWTAAAAVAAADAVGAAGAGSGVVGVVAAMVGVADAVGDVVVMMVVVAAGLTVLEV